MGYFDLSNDAGFNDKRSEEWLYSVKTDRNAGCEQEVTNKVIEGKGEYFGRRKYRSL
jgi:hypothetical protein